MSIDTKYVVFQDAPRKQGDQTPRMWHSRRVPTSFDETRIDATWYPVFPDFDGHTIRHFEADDEARRDATARQAEDARRASANTFPEHGELWGRLRTKGHTVNLPTADGTVFVDHVALSFQDARELDRGLVTLDELRARPTRGRA